MSVVDGAVLVEGSDGQLYGRRGDETLSAWQIAEALRNGYVDSMLAEKLPQLRADQRADARERVAHALTLCEHRWGAGARGA